MTIVEAIENFRVAADAKSDGITPESRDHALHARMARAFYFLSSHGAEGVAAFSALLHDDSPMFEYGLSHSCFQPTNVLPFPVMEQLAAARGVLGLASTTLSDFVGKPAHPFIKYRKTSHLLNGNIRFSFEPTPFPPFHLIWRYRRPPTSFEEYTVSRFSKSSQQS